MFAVRNLVTKSIVNGRAVHSLPELPYAFEALEPIISREIMYLHHQKHHQTYVNNLNAAEDKLKEAISKGDVTAQIALGQAIKFNGGGHINHSIFWKNLTPDSCEPSQEFCRAIKESFGDVEKMKAEFSAAAIGVQGSGWAWLTYDKSKGCLRIATCANQDPVEATLGLIPILGIDVWEHAYYLQYKNVRADYVKAIFDIFNWKEASETYSSFRPC